ncbi:hypothetical protein GCM10010495_41220 [Kitasatospora herbaricolor]|nr:hypothetical protein GCM10010495_41220 [Kitasatospora herbaricolor]
MGPGPEPARTATGPRPRNYPPVARADRPADARARTRAVTGPGRNPVPPGATRPDTTQKEEAV